MDVPFDFEENEIPEASVSGSLGNLPDGIYNLIFNRIADANDNADENGQVSGKNDWKALKIYFSLKCTSEAEKPIVLDATFQSDYDPTITGKDGKPMRDWMIENGKSSYKAMMFYSGATDLRDPKTSLVGRELSCLVEKDDAGYLKLVPGSKGQNWGELQDLDKPEETVEATTDKVEAVRKETDPKPTETEKDNFSDEIPF